VGATERALADGELPGDGDAIVEYRFASIGKNPVSRREKRRYQNLLPPHRSEELSPLQAFTLRENGCFQLLLSWTFPRFTHGWPVRGQKRTQQAFRDSPANGFGRAVSAAEEEEET